MRASFAILQDFRIIMDVTLARVVSAGTFTSVLLLALMKHQFPEFEAVHGVELHLRTCSTHIVLSPRRVIFSDNVPLRVDNVGRHARLDMRTIWTTGHVHCASGNMPQILVHLFEVWSVAHTERHVNVWPAQGSVLAQA